MLGRCADALPDVITFSLANPKEKVTKRKDWSGREDSNLRPLAPHASALPGCATSRLGDEPLRFDEEGDDS